MSYRKLQITCNRCFKSFYGEEDLSCHMMMAHRTSDIVVVGTDAGRPHFASHVTKAKDEAREFIPPEVLSLMCKIEKYFEGITTDVRQIKEDVASNSTKILKLQKVKASPDFYTDKKLDGHKPYDFEGLAQCESEKNSTSMQALIKIISGQKELQDHMIRLDKKFENHKHRPSENKDREKLLSSRVTEEVPKDRINSLRKKSSNVNGRDDKIQGLMQQVEKEKERSRQLLGVNSQLKAQTKLLRSKMRQRDAPSAEKLNHKLRELVIKCDKLSKENNSLKNSIKHEEDNAVEYLATRNALEEKSEDLEKALASSKSDLKETKTRLEFSREQNNVAKDQLEQQQTKLKHLNDLIKQMAKEKKDTEHKMKTLLDEVELCRGEVMKKEFLEADLKEQQDRSHQLQEKITLLCKDVTSKDSKIQTLENTLKEVRCASDVLEGELGEATKENARLSEECSRICSEVDERKKQEESLQCAISEARESISKIDQENLTLQHTIERMKQQKCELEEARITLVDENVALRQSMADVQKQYDNSEQKLAEAESEKEQIQRELVSERKELKETEAELQEKVSALFYLDEKRYRLDEENERLEEINAELEEEISGYKELLADHNDLMNKHRQRLSEIENYKAEVEELKESEKENVEHLSVMVREGKRLGEEIAHLQQEKEQLESELDSYKTPTFGVSQGVAAECKETEPYESHLKQIVRELEALSGKKKNDHDNLSSDQLLHDIRLELESKNSKLMDRDISIAKLKAEVEQLTCNTKLAERKELEERYAKEETDEKVKSLEAELNELNQSVPSCINNFKSVDAFYTGKVAEIGDEAEGTTREMTKGDLRQTHSSHNGKVEDCDLEDFDEFEIMEPTITLDVSDDELFGRKPQKISQEELEADFYDSENSSCENEDQLKGYFPSRIGRVKEEFPTPPQLALLTPSVNGLPIVAKKSLLGPLPPLPKFGKVQKRLKPEKKKSKKKEVKENVKNPTHGKKTKKMVSKLVKDDKDDVELTSDDIANLLDNL